MPMLDHVFIHPLLGIDGAWSCYLVEFAPDAPSHDLLVNLDTSPLINEFDHRSLWFFPADVAGSDLRQLGERAIPVFASSAAPNNTAALDQQESELRKAKRKLGLLAWAGHKLPGAGCWDYLLIAASHARSLAPYTLIGLASRTAVISVEVQTHSDREWALNHACCLSTSEFLQVRSTVQTSADITRLKLLKLLALIVEDAETDALDAIFREEQKLSYSLLRLVNSAAISPRTPIVSFSQAINLLGRRQLQRWLQLLVYSDPNNGQHPNPLLQKAAARGRLLELLAPHLNGDSGDEVVSGDLAFMIGTFSLLDVLLNIPMSEILNQLPLPAIAQKALADHGGRIGKLLAAIKAAEHRELTTAAQRLSAIGIDARVYLDAQLDAFSWASKIRPPA